ncbi:hypothetical protein IMG5_174890 [Ichthyophthirius multifiliis]|uniref:Ion transport domain-containing protein n=1 Tax=Ichthyophthirius multifiliis TaxID=5932 RepID=G0R243_ICHMU|nr:hypothetical protein IMG5_174890 [Ichthyophthirius multifiliis]EGR28450.1 hypothetical protein IMG5_174890 [Ichthyophthirius multifiliis]|eukprot:XP_004029686.1 hypothetical protein IMG5_174890 [Ichthyophthirius multifiliis]
MNKLIDITNGNQHINTQKSDDEYEEQQMLQTNNINYNNIEFDENILKKNKIIPILRKTYIEFNTLMKQQTIEFINGEDEEDEIEEKEEQNKINSSIEEEEKKKEQELKSNENSKFDKYKTKRKNNQKNNIQANIEYEYPFPYNQSLKNQEEQLFLISIDQKLKNEYDTMQKSIEQNQNKRKENIIYPSKKNDFEMLSIKADSYPFLQLRIFILFIIALIKFICNKIIKNKLFDYTILFIIIFNSVMLALDDPTKDTTDYTLLLIDDFFLWAYTVECILKILGMGFFLNPGAYLRDGWNILDFLIVVTSLIPVIIGGNSSVNLSSLRSLRVLRPLRTISSIKELKVILLTLFSALPYLGNTLIILIFFFLIFAIAGLQLFMGILKKDVFLKIMGFRIIIIQFVGEKWNVLVGKFVENQIKIQIGIQRVLIIFLFRFQWFSNALLQKVGPKLWQFIQFKYVSLILYQFWIFDAFSIYTVIYFVLLLFVGSFFLLNLTLAVIKAKFSDNQNTKQLLQSDDNNKEQIDINQLKSFRRMERNHFKRQRLLKKLEIKVIYKYKLNNVQIYIYIFYVQIYIYIIIYLILIFLLFTQVWCFQ